MTKVEAEKTLKEIIIDNACIEIQDINDKRFFEDLQYDSLSIVQMMMDIEETFGIQIDNMEIFIEHIDTVPHFVNWILEEFGNAYGKIN